ncbi:MAG: alpha/beta hydrolase [Tolypothrix sp. T3-bin4]|nr:alpha/beta hydrolase [Tolypothrix sp. Co-bin9]MBD0303154.1 alpha/beta hydrolase [Tolypothrix sp. T3-bin4]
MKKLIFQLVIFILMLSGLVGYGFVNNVTSAPSCTIATHSVTVGNGTLFYNQVGMGRSILLLHGLFASKEQWESMMCQLSEAGYQAIAPDLPGYGNSSGFTLRDYTLENQVALLHEFMNQLKINFFDVAGSSMGGTIATLYSQRYPKQVHSLAFIGSPLGVIGWANSVRESIFEGVNPFIPITKEQFNLEISLLFVTPPPIPDSVKAEKVNDYITRNRHYQQIWDIVNLYDDVLCQKPLMQLPTLVIWGKEDRIYDIRGVNRLQRCISGSQIIQLPKAGHLLLMENATEAASNYMGFLRTTRGVVLQK